MKRRAVHEPLRVKDLAEQLANRADQYGIAVCHVEEPTHTAEDPYGTVYTFDVHGHDGSVLQVSVALVHLREVVDAE